MYARGNLCCTLQNSTLFFKKSHFGALLIDRTVAYHGGQVSGVARLTRSEGVDSPTVIPGREAPT